MKKIKVLFLLPTLCLLSCHSLTFEFKSADEQIGTVSCDGEIKKDNYVALTAKLNEGQDAYMFDSWYDQDNIWLSGDNPYYHKITEDITIVAKWVPKANLSFNFTPTTDDLNFTWIISLYHGEDRDVVIPDTYHGRDVVAIDLNTFPLSSELNTVTIGRNIKWIVTDPKSGESPFSNFTNRQNVKIYQENIHKKPEATDPDLYVTDWGWKLKKVNDEYIQEDGYFGLAKIEII